MGQYAQQAWLANLLPAWPPLHEIEQCRGEHAPLMKHDCPGCMREWQWCSVADSTVPAIKAGTWRCPDWRWPSCSCS